MSRQFTMEVGNYKVVNKPHLTQKKKTMKPTVSSSLFLRLAFSFPAKGKESYFTINTESISFYFFLFAPAWVTKPIAFPGIPFRTRAEKQRKKKELGQSYHGDKLVTMDTKNSIGLSVLRAEWPFLFPCQPLNITSSVRTG